MERDLGQAQPNQTPNNIPIPPDKNTWRRRASHFSSRLFLLLPLVCCRVGAAAASLRLLPS